MKPQILEITEENQELYLDQIADLEIKVLDNMEKNGKIGQLFITGKEDISNYIKSKENSVMCALGNKNNVISAVYITQGQKPFTYNDITKYFKCGKNYDLYVKNQFTNHEKYKIAMLDTYKLKLQAFNYAKSKILTKYPNFKSFSEFLEHELKSKNGFDEKSVLRDEINQYMSEFIAKKAENTHSNSMKYYEYFYWTTCSDLFKTFGKPIPEKGFEDKTINEYETFLQHQKLEIHDSQLAEPLNYYNANTENSIEIDTYITDPDNRHSGLARILVYEGIKKKIIENFKDPKNDRIYLCSTLHQNNLSSKYVSEFFDLEDNMFVKRRAERDREVHICRINRNNYQDYLAKIQDKLIVLYNYNPTQKVLSSQRKLEILKEQFSYEKEQYLRLNKIRNNNQNYTGSLKDIMPKLAKMGRLKQMIKELEYAQKQGDAR